MNKALISTAVKTIGRFDRKKIFFRLFYAETIWVCFSRRKKIFFKKFFFEFFFRNFLLIFFLEISFTSQTGLFMKIFVGENLCLEIGFKSGKKRWKCGQNKSFSCAKTKVTHWDSDGWTTKKDRLLEVWGQSRIFLMNLYKHAWNKVHREIICRNRKQL